jgi:hypothetical protein
MRCCSAAPTIEDVAGDVFDIEAPEALDEKSRELLWELVD